MDILMAWLLLRRIKRNRRQRKRQEAQSIHHVRLQQGANDNLLVELWQDPERFQGFHQLNREQFNVLLKQIQRYVQRMVYRGKHLSPGLRLSLTLRFIASGDSILSLSYLYRVEKKTVLRIIRKTARIIWMVLQPEVLPRLTPDTLKKIGNDFEKSLNFPNCIGAIDGKYVVCQGPNDSRTFKVVFLAVCDVRCCFTYVSVGSERIESEGGIFQNSSLREGIDAGRFALPPPRSPIGSTIVVPPVFVGDAGFPLKDYLMRPYLETDLSPEQENLNKRLHRTKHLMEATFVIYAKKWRIFEKPIIEADVSTLNCVVLCTVALHNWLRIRQFKEAFSRGQRAIPMSIAIKPNNYRGEQGLRPLPRDLTDNATSTAEEIRSVFARYFMEQNPDTQRDKPTTNLKES